MELSSMREASRLAASAVGKEAVNQGLRVADPPALFPRCGSTGRYIRPGLTVVFHRRWNQMRACILLAATDGSRNGTVDRPVIRLVRVIICTRYVLHTLVKTSTMEEKRRKNWAGRSGREAVRGRGHKGAV